MQALKRFVGRIPGRIQVDNGDEFISKVLDKWAYENKVVLDFSRPGKPTDNTYIESFNGSFRDECLNTHWFLSLDNASVTGGRLRLLCYFVLSYYSIICNQG